MKVRGLVGRGPFPRPRVSLLEGGRGAEHGRVVEAPSDNLKANRKAVAGEAARHRGRRLAGRVEGIREGDPAVGLDRGAGNLRGVVEAHLERRAGYRGSEQQVVGLEEFPDRPPEGEPAEPRLDVLRRRPLQRFLDDLDEPRIDVRPPIDRKSTRLNSSHGYISYAVFFF